MKDCSCINCLYSRTIPVTTDLLCKYAGVVSYDFGCRRYVVSPYGDKQLKYCRCDTCSYFSPKGGGNQGECRLFGLRNIDGYQHKGCGKYRSRYLENNTYEA